jgi:hypothetical protein
MTAGYMISTWVMVVLLVLSTSLLTAYTCLRHRNRRKVQNGRCVFSSITTDGIGMENYVGDSDIQNCTC